MVDDEPEIQEDERVRILAARRASEIVKREGAALALAAGALDDDAIAGNSHLLAVAIAQAIVDAYAGDILGENQDE